MIDQTTSRMPSVALVAATYSNQRAAELNHYCDIVVRPVKSDVVDEQLYQVIAAVTSGYARKILLPKRSQRSKGQI